MWLKIRACFGNFFQAMLCVQVNVPDLLGGNRKIRWTLCQRSCHTRENPTKELWQTFVDDRPVHRDAVNMAVFSFAMAVMDKSLRMGRRRKMARFSFCVMHVDVLCDEQESTHEHLKRRRLFLMESVNRVCKDDLEEHEPVSDLTISTME